MIKEALQYIVGLGNTEVVNEKGNTMIVYGNSIDRVTWPTQHPMLTSTLQSVVDYLRLDPDNVLDGGNQVIVHVENPECLEVVTQVNEDSNRSSLLVTKAVLPDEIEYGHYYDLEELNIKLQSLFVPNEDRGRLLKFISNVKDEAVKNTSDDGISQSAVVKTGIASVGEGKVPNPVLLAPYRTFPEIPQTESNFVFRMKSGGYGALFEADGGAWRIKAIDDVSQWLLAHLTEALGDKMSQVTILS